MTPRPTLRLRLLSSTATNALENGREPTLVRDALLRYVADFCAGVAERWVRT